MINYRYLSRPSCRLRANEENRKITPKIDLNIRKNDKTALSQQLLLSYLRLHYSLNSLITGLIAVYVDKYILFVHILIIRIKLNMELIKNVLPMVEKIPLGYLSLVTQKTGHQRPLVGKLKARTI